MDTNPSTNKFIRTFVVMKTVFDYLTPTDVSAFVHATRFYNMLSESMRDEYMNIEREVLMCQPWIGPVMDHGHLIAVVGRDIHQMMKMFRDPLKYWGNGMWRKRATLQVWLVAQNKYMVRGAMESYRGHFMLISRDGNVVFKPTSWVNNMYSHPTSTEVCNDEWCGQSMSVPYRMLFNPDTWPPCINYQTRWVAERQRPAVLSDTYGGSTKFIYCESYEGIFGGFSRMLEHRLVHSDSERIEHNTPYLNMYEGKLSSVEVYEGREWRRMHRDLLVPTGALYIHSRVVIAHHDKSDRVFVLRLKGIGSGHCNSSESMATK